MIRQSVLPVGHHTTLFTVSPSTHEYNWVPAYCKDNLMGILEGGGIFYGGLALLGIIGMQCVHRGLCSLSLSGNNYKCIQLCPLD